MPDETRADTSTDVPPLSVVRDDSLTISHRPGSRPHAVAPGSRVLHIGAPKTGTTAVQGAIDAVAGTARAHGVHVPGTPNEQAKAALAVLGQRVGWSQDPEAVRRTPWPRMAERIGAIPGTVFFSSEYLCEADPEQIERIVADLGAVHVVLTLRPLEKVLPSAWQQYLKSGHRRPYEQWLRAVLAQKPDPGVTPSFWRRHDQAAVAQRWARGAGADHVTVVVLPPNDRDALLTTFEDLLGLPAGTLHAAPEQRLNRSMTADEAELFRLVNVALRDAGLPWADYAHLMRYGAILRTVERPSAPGAPPIETPPWALERARELGATFASRIDRLRTRGLHVAGSLNDLHLRTTEAQLPQAVPPPGVPPPGVPPPGVPPPGVPPPGVPGTVDVEVAAQALLGAIARAATGTTYFDGEGQRTTGRPGDVVAGLVSTPAGRLTSPELSVLLARRVRESVERRARKLISGG